MNTPLPHRPARTPMSLAAILVAAAFGLAHPAIADEGASDLATAFSALDNNATWERVGDEIPVDFEDHHPQGMLKIGDTFFISTVRIAERPAPYDTPKDGFDRSAGKGTGFLLKLSAKGELLGKVELGEGDAYHPGGIDFDGTSIIVPVAEYRPNSSAIIYRVNPETLEATEILRFNDHLGGVTFDRENHRLHAVSWGSRRLYAWDLGSDGKPASASAEPVANPSFYIDYQDCHYAGPARMLCGGLTRYGPEEADQVAVGGLDLVDLERNAPVHQLPVKIWLRPDLVITNNPQFCEAGDNGVDCWFAPEDDATTIYHYHATPAAK
ncbi:hypothetical protein HNP73_003681 [Amaricoccus macauensis]|uniref:Uncharacterized protein n=1 Tax=Amaricoccus macauensis TaxID=57001 RepID=A0A840SNZ0_9RHOB|nr:DUF6454 family protein [Amaricoccus macauensis]MBB5223727.1 hypothetical protein [Amaricoccus macauensis]